MSPHVDRSALVALCVMASAALAVSVPQDSPEKYYFSRPNMQSNIVGVVMGDPPAYHLPRSEDIAWLREAWAERAALAYQYVAWTGLASVVSLEPTFGKWPLSYAGNFARHTVAVEPVQGGTATNIIVGYVAVTNRGDGVDTSHIIRVDPSLGLEGLVANTNNLISGYLSTNDSDYISAAVSFPDDGAGTYTAITNVHRKTVMLPAWSNCVSYIRMQMTNGTVSVWTNAWTAFAPTSAVVVVTNVVYVSNAVNLDWIFVDKTPKGYDRTPPGRLSGLLDTAAITNHYAFLRGARRLCRGVSPTNSMLTSYISYWNSDDGQSGPYEDLAYSYPWISFTASSQERSGYTNYYDNSSPQNLVWDKWTASYEATQARYVADGAQEYFLTIPRKAAIPDGRLTIRRARLYGIASARYTELTAAGTSPGNGDSSYEELTNMSWTCALPLGDVTMNTDGENIWFSRAMGFSDLANVWSSTTAPASLPSPDSHWTPGVKHALPEPSHGELDGTETNSYTETICTFDVSLPSLYLLIDFAPLASLPGWNE